MLAWLLVPTVAHALSCDEVFQLTASGMPEADVVARIRLGLDLTSADVTCLQAGGASRVVLDAARWKLAHPTNPAPAPAPVAPAPRPAPAGPRVDVAVVGAVFAPGKADGTSWDLDGAGAAVAGVVGTVGLVAVAGPGGAAAARLGQLGASGLAAPDPTGWVELVPASPGDGGPLYRRVGLNGGKDTYEPSFEPPARFRGWPLAELALRVHLWDEDGAERDDVPTVTLSTAELRAALAAPGVYAVPVRDATGGAITSILVRVQTSSIGDRRVEGGEVR